MKAYLIKRTIRGLITLWIIITVVFILLRSLGNPIDYLTIPQMSLEDRARLKEHYGFDKPLIVQYGKFGKGIFTGDFGRSVNYSGRNAFEVFKNRLLATVQLVGASLLFAMVVGLVLGMISATRPDSVVDYVIRLVAITGLAIPGFWLALLFILFFSVYLRWLPSAGGPERVGWIGLLMPAVTTGWFFVAANTRLLRSAMMDALASDYIISIRSKGMPQWVVLWKHALKNAIIPVLTLFGLNFALLVGGAVIAESIFAWPGIGLLMVESTFNRDYAVIQTIIFFTSVIIVTVNILVDVCYAWIDPRIRLA